MDYVNNSHYWEYSRYFSIIIKFRIDKKIEQVKSGLQQFREDMQLRRQYANPFLKSAEDLYNKLNYIVKNKNQVLGYFYNLSVNISTIKSFGEILSSAHDIYLTNVFYVFVQFWAYAETIKKDFGLFDLLSEDDNKQLQIALKRCFSVFPTG